MGKAFKCVTPEQELAICKRYEQVERARILVNEFGVSDQTIYRVLKKHGIPRTHRHQKPKGSGSNHKGIDRQKVGELYQSGVSIQEIADRFGCSYRTASYHLEKLGLHKRKGRTPKETIGAIEREYVDGASCYELGDKYGVNPATVSKWMRKRGHHRGKGFVSPRESVCERCGKTFVATKKNQIYCSETCCRAVCSMRRNDAKRVGADEVETITLREVWERNHGRCYLCGRKTDWSDYRTVNGWRVTGPRYPSRDHVIALSNGGTHTRDNIRLACFECNTNKNNHGQLRLAI